MDQPKIRRIKTCHFLSLYTNQTDDLIQKQVSPQPLHIVYAPLGQVSNTVIDFLPYVSTAMKPIQ